ncbi:universal stress protein [Streptomyces sp. SID14515]|uniref:universal stress protein n=1 Tax=Streptomyces sp. SID14515 TaxID=2706074 RepID=UPI0013C766BD|nr:universal stress protein [Streptomyces sp. SID14515]NEB36206.1 universal stress protein [Streptomyces sp. SID14515]
MNRHVTVGLDDSAESHAAAVWAAREASSRGVALRLVHVEEWPVTPEIPLTLTEALVKRYETLLRDAAERARRDHPGLDVTTEMVHGRAGAELTRAADGAEVTALGSRGLGGIVGFLVGSVSLAVVATSTRPVVLVRAEQPGTDAGATESGSAAGAIGTTEDAEQASADAQATAAVGSRPDVVLGLDIARPSDPLLDFAFGTAARRNVALRVVHSWSPPASYGYAAILDPEIGTGLGRRAAEGLTELLRPWRSRFPEVRVVEKTVVGPPARELVHASRGADLLVVGRRGRRPALPHLGHVAHAVIHHSTAPVAVVPLA